MPLALRSATAATVAVGSWSINKSVLVSFDKFILTVLLVRVRVKLSANPTSAVNVRELKLPRRGNP